MNERLIEQFRASHLWFVAAVTGGGAQFLADYLAAPGASASFLDAIIPYSQEAVDDFLGATPEQYCCERTARLLASAALRRAQTLNRTAARRSQNAQASEEYRLIGVGATAALSTNRPKKGELRVFCAVQAYFGSFCATLKLEKGIRTRPEEERLAADFILSTLLFAAQRGGETPDAATESEPLWQELDAPLPTPARSYMTLDDSATVSWVNIDQKSGRFLYGGDSNVDEDAEIVAMHWVDGRIERVRYRSGQERRVDDNLREAPNASSRANSPTGNAARPVAASSVRAFLPGSFNPPHRAHAAIASLAGAKLHMEVEPELSARNVDKPPLDPLEIIRRVQALKETANASRVWVTNAPRYVEKAEILPNSVFVLGVDTVLRLADPKYEGGEIERRDAALRKLRNLGARFIVFARKINGRVMTRRELEEALPPELRELCEFVEPDEFLDEISSSQLRKERLATNS